MDLSPRHGQPNILENGNLYFIILTVWQCGSLDDGGLETGILKVVKLIKKLG